MEWFTALIGVLDRAPLTFTIASMIGLCVVLFIVMSPRRRRLIAAIVILSPLSPIFVVRGLAVLIIAFCDWLVTKPFAEPFVPAARWIEREFLA